MKVNVNVVLIANTIRVGRFTLWLAWCCGTVWRAPYCFVPSNPVLLSSVNNPIFAQNFRYVDDVTMLCSSISFVASWSKVPIAKLEDLVVLDRDSQIITFASTYRLFSVHISFTCLDFLILQENEYFRDENRKNLLVFNFFSGDCSVADKGHHVGKMPDMKHLLPESDHLDISNPHSFEMGDLDKLIQKVCISVTVAAA